MPNHHTVYGLLTAFSFPISNHPHTPTHTYFINNIVRVITCEPAVRR